MQFNSRYYYTFIKMFIVVASFFKAFIMLTILQEKNLKIKMLEICHIEVTLTTFSKKKNF